LQGFRYTFFQSPSLDIHECLAIFKIDYERQTSSREGVIADPEAIYFDGWDTFAAPIVVCVV
jgi:hypothetical protein